MRERTTRTAHACRRRALLFLSLALPLLCAFAAAGGGASRARAGRQEARDVSVRKAVGELPARSKRYALVVGVDDYADAQIGALAGAANDARLLAAALIEHAGFPAGQVILLASNEPRERQPTRGQIMRSLSNLAAAVPADGLLLFSFAGHGVVRGGDAFLLSSDAQVNGDSELLKQTAVEAAWVRTKIEEGSVRQVLLLLDACRNDPRAGRSPAAGAVLREEYRRAFDFERRNRGVEAFATLYATAVGGRAYEYKEKRHGYFTWAVVEGLRGGAADARGEVTLAGLLRYVQENVARRVALDLGSDYDQRPFADVEGYRAEDLVLAVARASAVTPPRAAGASPELKPPANEETGGARPTAVAPTVPGSGRSERRSDAKAGRVLFFSFSTASGIELPTSGWFKNEKEFEGAFWRALSRTLIGEGLSTTAASEVGSEKRLSDALRKLERGEKGAGRTMPFAVVIKSVLTATRLAPYDGLHVAEVSLSLKAIDGDSGAVIAQEVISRVRGFGNTDAQAEDNALGAAGEKVSAAFVARVVSAAR